MSTLYLQLVRRIEEVAKWVPLGTDTMRSARESKGWSYETTAREIPVSSKTYERWEKRGEVPNHALEQVARVLDLSIEREERSAPITVLDGGREPDADGQRLDALVARQEEIAGLVLELSRQQEANARLLAELLRTLQDAQSGS